MAKPTVNCLKKLNKVLIVDIYLQIILLEETAKSPSEAERLKQIVFERINSGGVRLSYQESRNAIYDGPLNRLCIKLAKKRISLQNVEYTIACLWTG